jgi:hypothetical protein
MQRIFLIAVLGALSCPQITSAQPSDAGNDKPAPAAAALVASKSLAADLREARDLLTRVNDRLTRDRLELLLTRAELRLGDVQRNLAVLNSAAAPQPISQDDLDNLLKALRAQPFDNNKVPFITNIAPTRHFSSTQVRELLKTFAFDDGRGQAAVILYPRTTDPGNFFMALDVFTFDINKKAVREKLKLK